MLDLLERNSKCRLCSGPMKADVESCCLASYVKLICVQKNCGYIDRMAPLNCSVSWKAPKNKVFSGSVSLKLRIILAVALNSKGTLEVYSRLFAKLGIPMDPDVLHFFVKKDGKRSRKIEVANV